MSRRKQPAPDSADAALAEANAYIKRLFDDAELREAVGRAIESSRAVHDRVSGVKKLAKLDGDEQLRADAIAAIEAIRAAALRLSGGKRKHKAKAKRGSSFGAAKLLLLAGAGAGAALAASSGLRSKVLDALFGAEEEFEYSPPPPPPAATDAPGSPLSAV